MTVWGLLATMVSFVVAGGAFLYVDGLLSAFAVAAAVFFFTALVLGGMGRYVPLRPLRRRATTTGEFMMRIVDILYALPYVFLVILLMISFGRDIVTLFVALGAVQWLLMARIVRGQVLSLKEKEFVEAAHMCGTGHAGIIFRHLIPNTLGVVVVYATLTVPAVILQESFLAFIGLTVEWQGRTLDSWGALVNQGRQALTSTGGNWWVLVFPSLAMAVTLFSLNFLGDGLRDALDPQLKGRT
jgi:oligopeptide transport system permease protein